MCVGSTIFISAIFEVSFGVLNAKFKLFIFYINICFLYRDDKQ